MSFSNDMKNELLGSFPKSLHCRIALLAGYITICGRYNTDDSKRLAIRVENDELEAYILKLIKIVTDIPSDRIESIKYSNNQKLHHRKLLLENENDIEELFLKCKLKPYVADSDESQKKHDRISCDRIVIQKGCCKKAYLKGSFLAGGSMVEPEKSYQTEIAAVTKEAADKLCDILSFLDIKANSVVHKDRYLVYIKEGDSISDLLGVMGASNALMEFENIRIVKNIRNSINREVNCDAANMAKTAKSSAKQVEDIKYIINTVGIEYLTGGLREVAEVRLNYPDLSMKDLGAQFNPPLGKSGINHRFKKISELAEDIRSGRIKL